MQKLGNGHPQDLWEDVATGKWRGIVLPAITSYVNIWLCSRWNVSSQSTVVEDTCILDIHKSRLSLLQVVWQTLVAALAQQSGCRIDISTTQNLPYTKARLPKSRWQKHSLTTVSTQHPNTNTTPTQQLTLYLRRRPRSLPRRNPRTNPHRLQKSCPKIPPRPRPLRLPRTPRPNQEIPKNQRRILHAL